MGDSNNVTKEELSPELEPLNTEDHADLNKCEDFDQVLEVVGSQGKFQKILLYGIVCPIMAVQPFITLNAIFLLFVPDHFCFIPGRENTTMDLETWKSVHIPLDLERPVDSLGRHKYSQCTMYGADNGSIVQCENGWEYDKTEYDSTIPSAFNWVCDNADTPTTAFTVAALGNALGTIVFGHMADKVGRKPIFFLTMFINVFFRTVSLFVAQYEKLFLLTQFLVGTAFPVMFICPSMIIAEVCDKDFRGRVYAVTWMIWVVGMSALPLVAMLIGQWFIIGIVTTIPGACLLCYWFHLPESPRWLLSAGRYREASDVLLRIAETNGTSERVSKSQLDKTLQFLYESQEKTKGAVGVWTLFSRRRLAKNTLLLTLCWSINVVVYYGITLNTTQMSGNQFLNFFLLSVIELPSGMAGGYLVDKVGRRWTHAFFFCCCFVTCAAAALVVQYLHVVIWEIFTVILAKFAVTLTFLVVYLQGAEIFPTQLRSTGSGFASTIAAITGIIGPLMVAMGAQNLSYPYWIMGGLCFVGMIAAAFLPETLNQHLPETIQDAEDFGKDNKFWTLAPPSDTSSSERNNKGP